MGLKKVRIRYTRSYGSDVARIFSLSRTIRNWECYQKIQDWTFQAPMRIHFFTQNLQIFRSPPLAVQSLDMFMAGINMQQKWRKWQLDEKVK